MNLNPLFLFVLFSMGYVFGLLLKNPTAGKFLIFGFAGIFIYEPVKEAGLLASAIFVAGIISHHVTPSAILDVLPRLSLGNRRRPTRRDRPRGRQGPQRKAETTDETHTRYEEYVKRNRGEKAKTEQSTHEEDLNYRRGYASRSPEHQQKKPQAGAEAADRVDEKLRRERERLKREKERLEAERRKFDRQQREQQSPTDNRSDEQILGVSGEYTLAELTKARNTKAKRWYTSNMANEPPHLIRYAKEEEKKINLAYERLVEKFR